MMKDSKEKSVIQNYDRMNTKYFLKLEHVKTVQSTRGQYRIE